MFAQGSRTGLSYVVESSFGATPSSPAMITLPYNTHSLNLTKERVQGNEIRPDRIPRVDRHGNRSVGGDIVVDLRASDFDDFIESAFFSTFDSSGVIKIGTTPQYMTIEDRALDITQFRQFTGCAVSQMSVSAAPNQMVETTFSLIGKDFTQTATSLDSTPTAASSNQPFDAYQGSLNIGGSSVALITAIDFSINNELAPTFVVGSAATPQLEYGRATVEGTFSAYYEDATIADYFTDESTIDLSVAFSDPGAANTYTWDLSSVKVNSANINVNDPQSRIIECEFVALYNSGDASNIMLTKS